MKAILLSITWRSFENLFIIVPVGVTSKNVLIGAFITLEIMFSCKYLEDLILIRKISIALMATNRPVPEAYVKVRKVKYLNMSYYSLSVSSLAHSPMV